MAKIVTDSSALILLSKCNLIEKLCNSYDVFAPSSVISEVASDEIIEIYSDAALVAELAEGDERVVGAARGSRRGASDDLGRDDLGDGRLRIGHGD